MDAATAATLVVALVTLVLALVTYRLVQVDSRALDLSTRPLLGDPPPATDEQEVIQFGPPGRDSVQVTVGRFYVSQEEGSGIFQVSAAFRNIGAGVAAIQKAWTEPPVPGSVEVSRKFVPVGEHVRVNISVLTSVAGGERFDEFFWATDPFVIAIDYMDIEGRQSLTSKAVVRQYATQGPWVAEIALYLTGDDKPLVIGRSSVA